MPRIRCGCALVLLAFGLAACGGGGGGGGSGSAATNTSTSNTTTPTPTPAPTSTGSTDSCGFTSANMRATFLQLVNNVRAAGYTCGSTVYPPTTPLAWNDKLFAAATGMSNDMAANNFTSHTGSNGSTLTTRLTAAGYTFSTAGENVASGFSTMDSVIQGWLSSPGHCANIMSANYADIGVACGQGPAGAANAGSRYWTMDFGKQ
ncbi:CAP domain-containing protein [Andreprevotia chitinilytica]|uniref:CAP domain-containing protein n=1 Tax=Andreprevotia chitinilytica TaxID=396808 RepID=UPI00146FED5F|nr:CAP domain-containing protein [Andreprevotia chitinilytica]